MELEPSAQPAVHGAGLLDKGLLGLGSNAAAAPYFHKSSTYGGLLLVLLALVVAMAASQQLPLAAGGGLSAWFALFPFSIPINH